MTRTGQWARYGICLIAAMATTLSAAERAAPVARNTVASRIAGPDVPAASPVATSWILAAADASSREELFDEPKPGSKDALFGESKPESRESLFGEAKAAPAASEKGARLSGFIEGVGAYTTATPRHWSRGVARLQVAAQGELGGGVKWKVGGRADADLVYATSDFYTGAVKRDQRIDFFHRENYLDFSLGDWDIRLGAQQIVWGEVMGLFFADVVSARDMREFLLPGFDVIRIPQWAARAEYTTGDSHLELVFIPVPTFDRIGKPGSDFYPVPLPSPASAAVTDLFRDPQRPERSLRNANFGIRANTLKSGWDLAAFFYRSFATSPTFHRLPSDVPGQPFMVLPLYDRISQTGGTVSKDLGDFVLRGEVVHTQGQNFSVSDLTATQSVVERRTLDYIVALEWSLPEDTRLNVQGFQRHYFGGGAGALAIPNDGFGASVFVSRKFGSFEPQLLWIRNFGDGGSMIRPRVAWTAARNLTVGFGADFFTGAADTFFGRYNNRDRWYADVRYAF